MLSSLKHSLKKAKTQASNTESKRYSLTSVASSSSHASSKPHFSGIRFKNSNPEKKTYTFTYDRNGQEKEKTITVDENNKLFLYINNLQFELQNDITGDDRHANHMLIYFYRINHFLDGDNNPIDISKTCIVNLTEFNYETAKIDNSGKLLYGDLQSDEAEPDYLPTEIFYEERKPTRTNPCTGNISVGIYLPGQKPLLLMANHTKFLNRIFFDKNETLNKYYNENNITLNELLNLPNVALIIRKPGTKPDEIIKKFHSKVYKDYYFERQSGKLNIVHNMGDRHNKVSTIGDFLSSAAVNNKYTPSARPVSISISDYLLQNHLTDEKYTPIVNFMPPKSVPLESMGHTLEDYNTMRRHRQTDRSSMAPESARSSIATGSTRSSMAPESARSSMAPESARSSMAPESARSSMAPASARNSLLTERTRSGKKTKKRSPIKGKPSWPAPSIPSKNKTKN